jgi:hypothetical protein
MGFTGFLLWIFLCVIVAVIAKNRGRSSFPAFLISFAFSPLVGLIVVLVSSKNQARLDNRAVRAGKAKRCPRCAELVKPKALVCKHCGNNLPGEVKAVNLKPISNGRVYEADDFHKQ